MTIEEMEMERLKRTLARQREAAEEQETTRKAVDESLRLAREQTQLLTEIRDALRALSIPWWTYPQPAQPIQPIWRGPHPYIGDPPYPGPTCVGSSFPVSSTVSAKPTSP